MNLDLARSTLKGVLAFDRPIGELMELARILHDRKEQAALKQCCGALLSLQFDLVEQIAGVYPELRQEFDREEMS
jgi:hypothetical protein